MDIEQIDWFIELHEASAEFYRSDIDWCIELQETFIEFHRTYPYILDWEDWIGYFDDGYSPQEAIYEDASCG